MKILVLGSLPESLLNFRGPLLARMVGLGHEVLACASGDNSKVREGLLKIGVKYQSIRMERAGLNPLSDVACFIELLRVLHAFRPEMILGYTIKPVIYGSLTARILCVREIYSIITGLGFVFMGDSLRQKLLRTLVCFLYRFSLNTNRVVFFQNCEDMELFRTSRLMGGASRAVLVNGSGVDLDYYRYAPASPQGQSFLLIARLLKAKGLFEYVEAAHILKQRYPKVVFRLLGPIDNNPSAISIDMVHAWHDSGVIEYLGETDDVRPFLVAASVFVLPTFYREGIPRSVLEAMAMGRPIITTDAPGCRETVLEGENGFLVPVKDSLALATAMERFILEPGLIPKMGRRSREIAEEKYDVHKVNAVILGSMGLLDEKGV